MSWLVGSLVGKALDAVSTLSTGFVPQVIAFEGLQVVTTALLAEGGYSFVYSAREVSTGGKSFAVKKVLAQDKETREIAEMESRLLKQLNGTPGFVGCFGTTHREATAGAREYFMLLELCPNGSLIDLVYRKDARTGAYARGPALSQERILEVFETVCASVAHLHALSPPVCHRDLKLENVLCTEDGRFVLCDFGSATTRVLPEGRSRREAAAEEERIAKYSTQMYRAPEMLDLYLGHAVDVRVDVWALGCILYTLCFGAHPFPAESSLQILNLAYSIPPSSQYSESATRAPTRAGEVDPALSDAPSPLASPAFEAAFEAAFDPAFEAAFERPMTLRTAHVEPEADADTTKSKGGLLRACIDFDVGPWERAAKRLSEQAALLEADERRFFLRV
ncbi:cyclin-g-associated kinase-like protein [Chrysochromulina tobinii]|uniref:non-specific serine/threonine protein kinase n=1 Tax=Chrysochromulina tobinii TaxID=1460289 RepID=A0A0M0K450_9EUKA|nr:cyclin-g-associated kinase-like protein [Chrysochromulina tobinii]|eukprot:KOO33646.1 cyclin-g-associated kinase-like protein [Chrysochromulina sp. CCMP291]